MKIAPNSTIRIANSEAVSLELAATAELASVTLTPRFGDAVTIPLAAGKFDFPTFAAPNIVEIGWFAADSDEPSYTDTAEVVSSQYFTLDELENYDERDDTFSELSDEVLWAARQAATDIFEEAAHRCFVGRIGYLKDYGRGLILAASHDLKAIETDGYAVESDSYIRRVNPSGEYPRTVEYIYGAGAIPAAVSKAVLDLAAYMLRPSNRPIGATGESTDAGYIHFTIAGRDGATAIPEVNAVIEQFGAGDKFVW